MTKPCHYCKGLGMVQFIFKRKGPWAIIEVGRETVECPLCPELPGE